MINFIKLFLIGVAISYMCGLINYIPFLGTILHYILITILVIGFFCFLLLIISIYLCGIEEKKRELKRNIIALYIINLRPYYNINMKKVRELCDQVIEKYYFKIHNKDAYYAYSIFKKEFIQKYKKQQYYNILYKYPKCIGYTGIVPKKRYLPVTIANKNKLPIQKYNPL